MDLAELEAFLAELDDPELDDACQDMALAMVAADRPAGIRRIIRMVRRRIHLT